MSESELETWTASCAWCGERIELAIDPTGGRLQQLVEDCWVCCRPNLVKIRFDGGALSVEVDQE